MAIERTDGTLSSYYQVDVENDGPRIQNESGVLESRDADGAALVRHRAADPLVDSDLATKGYVDSQGSGITEVQHAALRQLIHFIDSGPAEQFASGATLEILPAGDPFPTSEIWWESGAKLEKIVELTTAYNTNKTVNTETWNMYDEDGSTVLVTVTDTYTYSGVFPTSVTRVIV